jgi:predicted unusual protein kinase regulating ubiquinone biosynthesis (AarF/ABC1/UbiB family)
LTKADKYQLTVQTAGVTSLTTALQQMGFDAQSCLATADFQDLCQTIGLIHTDFRHNDLHCGNVLACQDSFKVIDVGDMEENLIASDMARLETSLWFELAEKFSPAEAEEVVKRLGKLPSEWMPSKSDQVEAFSGLLYHLYQGFQAGLAGQRLAEEQRELAYLLQILLYQRYWLLDGVAEVPPALKVFVAHHLKFWHPRLRKLPPKPLKLRDCVQEGLSRFES